MITWRDVTSYSRGEAVRVPRVLEADFGICRVVAHRLHGRDEWFVSCRELNISRAMLDATNAEDAQREGLEYVRATVRKLGEAMAREVSNEDVIRAAARRLGKREVK